MPYNSVADSFNTKNSVADFLQTKRDFRQKTAFCVFEPPPCFGGLGATYDDHLRLIGKRVP